MRKSEIVVLLIACLMFAIGMPSKQDQAPELVVAQEQEAEMEEAEPDFLTDETDESYQVTFKAASREQNQIADALWLRKAAQVALDAGVPYFNVKTQKVRTVFDSRRKQSLRVVEGRIMLDNDPMNSDYDANEIMELSSAAP